MARRHLPDRLPGFESDVVQAAAPLAPATLMQRVLPDQLPGFSDQPVRERTTQRDNFFLSEGGFGSGGAGFDGARRDRMTADWSPIGMGAMQLHSQDAWFLRDRARDLVRNNPLARSAIESYTSNVVGCGILPKPMIENESQRLAWVDQWNWWGGEGPGFECDSTGQSSIYEMARLMLAEVLVGGGCLQHYVELSKRSHRGRSLPLTVELVPEERFATHLDSVPGNPKTANQIVAGVELEPATKRPIAYWVNPVDTGNDVGLPDPIRLSRERAHYAFPKNRIGEYRGFTALATSIMWLWKLGYYVDNELLASAMKSCFGWLLVQGDGEDHDWDGGLAEETSSGLVDMNGNPLFKMQPGTVGKVLKGGDVKGVGPNVPQADSLAWMMLIQRSIAIGMGLSYEELCRDYSQGNFSSTRAASNGDKLRYRIWQQWMVDHYSRPVYRRFVNGCVMYGLDGFPTAVDFTSNPQKWTKCRWRKPGWSSVNPWDDARAAALLIDKGMDTRDRYIGERGGDWEDDFEQMGREKDKADELELPFSSAALDQAEASSEAAESGTQQKRSAA